MTTQFIATVIAVKEVTTKDGRRATLIEGRGNLKDKFTIWLGANHTAALALNPNELITCTVDSKGKERWVENVPVKRLNQHTTEFYTPNEYSPLATMPKTVEAPAPANSGMAFDRHIENLASKIADCYKATQSQLPNLSEETIQKLATSVFIQLCKDTY